MTIRPQFSLETPGGIVSQNSELDPRRSVSWSVNILIPPEFIDNNPERGPWHDPTAERPGVFIYVQALYADSTTGNVVWTGNLWWYKGVVEPVAWRPLQAGTSI